MTATRNPDPSQGIFETMLVLDGAAIAPEAHLARLGASLEAVYATALPAHARQLVDERAPGLDLGRLRLTFVPEQGIEVEAGEIDRSLHFPAHTISLRAHRVSGGLGCHKWADRAALPQAGNEEAALLVDGGEALEADRANVFAVRRGTVFTPSLDGRILPGVTRATTIELARSAGVEVVEAALMLDQLRDAEEVFLTNSIRGIESISKLDGVPLPEDRTFTHRLAEALRSRWKSEATARRRPLRTSA
jgi:para-aminobenzoate synthetase/4-amino-4-deoxychorismate lyase